MRFAFGGGSQEENAEKKFGLARVGERCCRENEVKTRCLDLKL
jgi:hypothetical protein